jgi:hypothetical protein
MNLRRLARLFESAFDSNDCEPNQDKDGVIKVAYRIGPIEHIMKLEPKAHVFHILKIHEDPNWYPSLRELDQQSEYYRLLRILCEDNTYPTNLQMKSIMRCNKMSSALFTIYGTKFTSFLADAQVHIRNS